VAATLTKIIDGKPAISDTLPNEQNCRMPTSLKIPQG
jgi:hypothetical protein